MAYFQEYSKCYAGSVVPQQCKLQADDYMECLHGKKAIARKQKITDEAHKQSQEVLQQRIQEEGPTISVGLIKSAAKSD
ncbi:hypothetical protein CYLTODRAFT_453349 [Cylindrobasidium torrendii FP15055 ss-10]|uniref:NADH dehydrogenase [ubiquinone] iron-sulfur protein 5 n=1 Tax=Cylindrobasidium torrendii FP15055 ss-10 TaxID=1314674 RepID=A0A0D7BDZ5_9AGAR|nr:hypothetical protein CYLTODRAFT_453349 [Cylindrobasidium torrendii FP15055 ss-10]